MLGANGYQSRCHGERLPLATTNHPGPFPGVDILNGLQLAIGLRVNRQGGTATWHRMKREPVRRLGLARRARRCSTWLSRQGLRGISDKPMLCMPLDLQLHMRVLLTVGRRTERLYEANVQILDSGRTLGIAKQFRNYSGQRSEVRLASTCVCRQPQPDQSLRSSRRGACTW